MIYRNVILPATWLLMSASVVSGQEVTCDFRGSPEALAERPSPLDSVYIGLNGEAAKLCYGRPSSRGRTVVGDVEPFGTPWRFGANEPTTLHLPFRASVGGVDLAPGSYSLYAIPQAEEWTIVVNANTHRWGIPINPDVRRSDVGSFTISPERLSEPVETLTFTFEGSGGSGALIYAWETSTFRIPVARR